MQVQDAVMLNSFFSRATFRDILDTGVSEEYNRVIDRCIPDKSELINEECISEIYQFLKQRYRNEYFYKNTLLNKYLFGIHSPRTTTALTELPVAGSIADLVMTGEETVVFEIKTGLDNFERLDCQLTNYYKAFSKVCVVTAPKYEESLRRKLEGTPVGIIVLTSRGTLHKTKNPIEYREKLSHDAMFKILRKNEWEKVLLKRYGDLPHVSQFEYYKSCKKLYSALPVDDAQQLFFRVLRNRNHLLENRCKQVPYSLRFIAYFSDYKEKDYNKLFRFLNQKRRTECIIRYYEEGSLN